MDELFEKSLLYDFYGELLTEHQRAVYESFVFEDMSLAEVAEEQGITRQGVHDLVKRCDKILQGYEDKLHLLEKFLSVKKNISEINGLTEKDECFTEDHSDMDILKQQNAELKERLEKISVLASHILEEL